MTPLDPPDNPVAAAIDHRDTLRPEVQSERRYVTQAPVVLDVIASGAQRFARSMP